MRPLLTAVLLLLLVFSSPSTATVVFYNPIDEIGARCPAATIMGEFLKEFASEAGKLELQEISPDSAAALIAVAIWPGRTADLWLDVDGRYMPDASAKLKEQLRKLGAPSVRDGPLAFAIHLPLDGSRDLSPNPSQIPQVWKEAVMAGGSDLVLPEGVLELVSPNHASEEPFKPFVPKGYVLHFMEATGGSIMVPADWHFSGGMNSTGFEYIASREHNEDGSYETGFRIRGFIEIQSHNLTPAQAKDQVLNSFKRSAMKILSECSNESAGFFTRDCLEVIQENPADPASGFHVIHSFFWNEDADIMVVTTFGSPEDERETMQTISQIMSEFTLIDISRLKHSARSAPEVPPPAQ